MNNTLPKAFEKLVLAQACVHQAEQELFADHRNTLFNRLIETCKARIIGLEKPSSCCNSNSILFGIANMTPHDLIDRKYPASRIEWEFSGGVIQVIIEAWFRGELDAGIDLSFPVKQEDFDAFINDLKANGAKRLRVQSDAMRIKMEAKEAEERALFQELKAKYDNDLRLPTV